MLPRDMMLRRRARKAATGLVSGDPKFSDRLGWPVDALSASLAFDWADGDGTTPATGPTMTQTGTVQAGKSTPWTMYTGAPITASYFDGSSYWRNTGDLDATAGDDIVAVVLVNASTIANLPSVFSTGNDNGWSIYGNPSGAANLFWRWRLDDGPNSDVSYAAGTVDTWYLLSVTWDNGTRQWCYADGVQADTDVVTASLPNGAHGVALGVRADSGNNPFKGYIARAMVWYGAGIAATADAAWHSTLAAVVKP